MTTQRIDGYISSGNAFLTSPESNKPQEKSNSPSLEVEPQVSREEGQAPSKSLSARRKEGLNLQSVPAATASRRKTWDKSEQGLTKITQELRAKPLKRQEWNKTEATQQQVILALSKLADRYKHNKSYELRMKKLRMKNRSTDILRARQKPRLKTSKKVRVPISRWTKWTKEDLQKIYKASDDHRMYYLITQPNARLRPKAQTKRNGQKARPQLEKPPMSVDSALQRLNETVKNNK